MLLAGRVRKPEEAEVVKSCIQKHLKRTVDPDKLFCLTPQTSATTVQILQKVMGQSAVGFEHIVWTYGMRRLAVLIGQAIKFNEPVLLVGETGYVMCFWYQLIEFRFEMILLTAGAILV